MTGNTSKSGAGWSDIHRATRGRSRRWPPGCGHAWRVLVLIGFELLYDCAIDPENIIQIGVISIAREK